MFAAVPAGTRRVRSTHTPARYRTPAFQGAGWAGPSITLRLASGAPAASVYGFYSRRAKAAGWKPLGRGALGFTDRWQKTYPDGAAATLVLSLLTQPSSASPRRYVLAGGIAPITR